MIENSKSSDFTPHYELNVLLEGIAFEAYQTAPGINASGLKTILRSPAHWRYERDIAPKKETPAMRFGTLLHAAVLEPERFEQQLAVAPEINLRTTQGKADLAAWRASLALGALEATAAEWTALQGALAAVRAHRPLMRLLTKGKRETCLFWQDRVHGVLAKGRMDFVAEDTGIVVDVKTTLDARPDAFARTMTQQNYALSASHYLEGIRTAGVGDPDMFVFVAIERDPPHGIRLYQVGVQELERGRGWRDLAMKRYAECLASDRWPGYTDRFDILKGFEWAPVAPDSGEATFF